ncbi:MAG: class I SAM-dependent methyltransferase [Eubacteriaceae bacterium]|nr:class I SAM-dependent methyltransferase [Eubacteriaceae bacterium]
MDDFFASRVEEYDEHMLTEVEGGKEGYIELAKLVPDGVSNLLDLGCGTGLELEEIFKICPDLAVTGIDISKEMLKKLEQKYPHKHICLVCADYMEYSFGDGVYDCAVSFESLHHLSHSEKLGIYKKIYSALKTGGIYAEGDYMVETLHEELNFLEEGRALREERGAETGELLHIDIPFAISTQLSLLGKAGFYDAKMVWRMGATTIITGKKELG